MQDTVLGAHPVVKKTWLDPWINHEGGTDRWSIAEKASDVMGDRAVERLPPWLGRGRKMKKRRG